MYTVSPKIETMAHVNFVNNFVRFLERSCFFLAKKCEGTVDLFLWEYFGQEMMGDGVREARVGHQTHGRNLGPSRGVALSVSFLEFWIPPKQPNRGVW